MCTTVVLDQYVHTLFAIRMCKVHSICSADSLDKADVQSGLRRSLDLLYLLYSETDPETETLGHKLVGPIHFHII